MREILGFLRDGSETLILRILERFGGFVIRFLDFPDIAKRPWILDFRIFFLFLYFVKIANS
jgi:hypothetical protein